MPVQVLGILDFAAWRGELPLKTQLIAGHEKGYRAEEEGYTYTALDVEELGSVYESLLDFQPVIRAEGDRLVFEFVQGTERNSTGSYYTRPELVESALAPVIEERLKVATIRQTQDEASPARPSACSRQRKSAGMTNARWGAWCWRRGSGWQ